MMGGMKVRGEPVIGVEESESVTGVGRASRKLPIVKEGYFKVKGIWKVTEIITSEMENL